MDNVQKKIIMLIDENSENNNNYCLELISKKSGKVIFNKEIKAKNRFSAAYDFLKETKKLWINNNDLEVNIKLIVSLETIDANI